MSVTDQRRSNRLRRRHYANPGGARLWTGRTPSNGGGVFVAGLEGRRVQNQLRTFDTTTRELVQLLAWLVAEGCTHVAMESTAVYWKPVYAVLEGGELEIIVANAQQVKKVPGPKTDLKDAEWIADLLPFRNQYGYRTSTAGLRLLCRREVLGQHTTQNSFLAGGGPAFQCPLDNIIERVQSGPVWRLTGRQDRIEPVGSSRLNNRGLSCQGDVR